jgi:DNA primase
MPKYTADSVERVKDAVDMVDLVSAHSDLRRVGQRWTGLCPFHDERTPSFSVNAEHKRYHCFGCSASGDAIDFVQEIEALDFVGSLEFLAERYNVELKREAEDPEAEQRRLRRERLIKLADRAATYYARVLWESPEAAPAREYLNERGLSEEVLKEFRIGYSPSAWDRVTSAAVRDGFSVDDVVAAGLGQRKRDGSGVIDRFRGRIMFPLADPRGKVLGFGARRLHDDDNGPKYLNTSENELYQKGKQLFGIHLARPVAGKAGRVVAVEGYTDVLALHQAGIKEAVAIMGTAVTPDQLVRLRQAASTIYFALDADTAGQEAMARAARSADGEFELRVVQLPEGTDPAELVDRAGPEAFVELLERGAVSIPEFEVKRALAAADLSTPGGRDEALSAVVPVIGHVPRNSATWDALVRYVSDKLDVDPRYLQTLLSAPRSSEMTARAPDQASVGGAHTSRLPSVEAAASAERTFLAMCLAQGESGRRYLEGLHDDHFSSPPLRRVRDHLVAHFGDPLADLPEDEGIAGLITQVAFLADDQPASESSLRLQWLQLELRKTERRLRHAAESADYDIQRALWPQREGLRREIDELMGQTQ